MRRNLSNYKTYIKISVVVENRIMFQLTRIINYCNIYKKGNKTLSLINTTNQYHPYTSTIKLKMQM